MLDKLFKHCDLVEKHKKNKGIINNNTNKIYVSRIYFTEKKHQIKIEYGIKDKNKEIKLFGKKFVENNKRNCYILYKNKKYNLIEYFSVNKDEKRLKIELIKINNIVNLEEMFHNCRTLISVTGISYFKKITKMNGLFYECFDLESIPDFSNLDTIKVTNMNSLF